MFETKRLHMKHTLNRSSCTRRSCVVLLVVLLAPLIQATTNAANILFVINEVTDPATTANANDQEVRDRLTAQGHTVTLADDQDPALGDLLAGKDLILISSSTGSGNQPMNALAISTLRTGRIPVVCYEPGLYDELLFQNENTFGNAGGHTSLAISAANQNHPLAAAKSGTVDIVNSGDTATVSSSALPYTVGTNALVIATNATPDIDVGRICIWGYEKGSRLSDNNTVVSSRRVAFFYNATTAPGVYNDNATALFDAAIKWALQPPPNLPITAVLRSPPAQNAAPDASIIVELEDGGSAQVNTNSISLSLNATAVAAAITKSGTITTVAFSPATVLPAGSSNSIRLAYSDNGTPSQLFTNTFQFTVENYVTILPNLKLPASSIDRNKPGFTIKLRQMEVARPGGNLIQTVRTQLSDGFIDPNTSQPYPDLVDRSQTGFQPPGSGFQLDGTFTELGIINYNQDANGVGAEMGAFVAPDFPDKPIPGIPGTSSSTDNIAMQARTVLELKAGLYRFAVNSDDGFGVTVGSNPQDAFALRAGAFDADRGQATTEFSIVVGQDGLYPFELIWWETGGGAEVEFFSVTRATGQRILINDTGNASAIKAFQPLAAVGSLPTVTSVNPKPGAVSVPKDTSIDITITDGTVQVVTNSIKMTFNGTVVSPSVTRNAAVTTIRFKPAGDLTSQSVNTVTLEFLDSASPLNSRSESWNFVVETTLPKAIFVIGNAAAPNASENAIRNRLQSTHGFEATFVDDDDPLPANAGRAALILVSSTSGSGNISKYRDVTAPILDWEWAAYDGLALSSGDGQTIDNSQTQIEIVKASHPLAAGFPSGVLTLFPAAAAQFASVDPTLLAPSVTVVANTADGTGSAVLFGVEAGAPLQPDPNSGNPVTAPARRAGIFLGGDTFVSLNPDGLKLFDAAVRWTANISPGARFNASTLSAGNITLSWTGAGTLEQTDSLSPPNWTTALSQNNPQTVPATGTRFYRIRQ
jgi:hypothetical protein